MKSTLIRGLFSLFTPRGASNKLTILQFHKVPRAYDELTPGELLLERFEEVLDFFAENMTVMSLSDATRAMAMGTLPKRAVALTLDDGYAEWCECVAPALRRRNLPATFYVTTEQLSGPALWHERIIAAVRAFPDEGVQLPIGFQGYKDLRSTQARARLTLQLQERFKYLPLIARDAAIERLEAQAESPLVLPRRFTADSVRDLHSQGFEIGAHTVRHPILNETGDGEARDEIGGCKEELESLIRGKVNSFAYPNGLPSRDYSSRHVELVKACGYTSAVVTGGGVADGSTDVFQLPRFTPWGPGPGRMALQIARNALVFERGLGAAEVTARPPRVLVVENGAGFGGAIIALQTLLDNFSSDDGNFHLVVNLPVGRFKEIPSVKSLKILSDRSVNFRAIAQGLRERRWLIGLRGALFVVGRLDDLINRLPYVLRLMFHAIKVRPDIIHGNNEPGSNREALIVAKLLGKPYVQHVRGALSASLHTPWLLTKPDAFIPVSRWLAEELLINGVPSSRIHQVYDAVDIDLPGKTAATDLRAELGLAPETIIIAMVGMLVIWKGQNLFIDAVKRIKNEGGAVAYLIIGGTPELGESSYAESLQQQVRDLGLEKDIIFTGRRDDLKAIMPQIDVVVSASTEPEPLGLVMLEAMVSGCVFVGPAHGAAIEVVNDGENGYLFDPCSAESLARKLELAIDAVNAKSMDASTIGDVISRRFGGEYCSRQTLAIYRSLNCYWFYAE